MATIRKRKNKWEVQIRIRGYKNISKSFLYREHAFKWARETEIKVEKGIYQELRDLHSIKFKDLVNRYLIEISPTKKSYPKEKYTIGQLLRDPIVNLSITALTTYKLVEYRNRRLKRISAPTVNREISLISSVLTKAQELWSVNLSVNPARNLKRLKENKSRSKRLTAQEFMQLVNACNKSKCIWLKSLFSLAIETGMRRGELLSLTRDMINLNKRIIFLKDTKNGSARTVPLSEKAIHEIKSLPVSFNRKIFPISISSFRFYWKQAKNRANIVDFRFHDCRHEAISRFFEKGLSIPEVALISGHKDVRMLFRYTHLKAEDILRKL